MYKFFGNIIECSNGIVFFNILLQHHPLLKNVDDSEGNSLLSFSSFNTTRVEVSISCDTFTSGIKNGI